MRHSLAVKESLRFALREAFGGGHVACYTLRGTKLVACLRHDEHDAWVLHEVIGTSSYELPPGARDVLNGTEGPLRVVDVGAHVGFFGLFVLSRYPNAEITALEPDPSNAALLRECIRRNRKEHRWRLVQACASTNEGSAWFAGGLGERSHASIEPQPGAIEVPAVDLFRYLREVDLLKIDIEGGEWPILADERLARSLPRVIILEYHPLSCPEPDPKQVATSGLEKLGYRVEQGASLTPEVGTLWAWWPSTTPAKSAKAIGRAVGAR